MDEKVLFKYPFVASSIIACDSPLIIDAFFSEKPSESNPEADGLLERLFGFLDSEDSDAYDTLAGYFYKCVSPLVRKKPLELFRFLKKKNLFEKLLDKTDHKSTSDIILEVLMLESVAHDDKTPEKFTKERVQVVGLLLRKLTNPKTSQKSAINISSLIKDLLTKYQCALEGREMLQEAFSPENSKGLIASLGTCKENCDSIFLVLIQVIEFYVALTKPIATADLAFGEEESKEVPIDEQAVAMKRQIAEVFVESIDGLIKSVEENTEKETITLQFSQKVKKLGLHKAKCIDLMSAMIRLEEPAIGEGLIKGNFFEKMLRIGVDHPWNSIMHSRLFKVTLYLLENCGESFADSVIPTSQPLDFPLDPTGLFFLLF